MKAHHFMLLLLLIVILPLTFWVILSAFRHKRIQALYRQFFHNARRERLFLSSLSFYLTFAAVRYITHLIHLGRGEFRNLYVEGFHLHHLVWGILLLLGVGYLWLMQIGSGVGDTSRWPSRLTAVFYGLGAALTLDEFALWLRLQDVYWAREGRESVDAVILFGALLVISAAGAAFFRAMLREAVNLFKR